MKVEDIFEVRAVRKRVIRKGKQKIKRDCPPGYKLVGGTRCVRLSGSERVKKRRAGIKAAKKGKAKRKISQRRSLQIRKRRGLKKVNF